MGKRLIVGLLGAFLSTTVHAQTSAQIEANKGVLKLAPTAQLPAPTCRLGQLWFDSTTATVKLCDDGANWVEISGTSTITNGVTPTSGCVAGGVLRSISNLVECGAGFTYATGVVGVGTASTTLGKIDLFGATHAFKTTLRISESQGAGIEYTLPTTDGDASQFLQTNGSGVLTWAGTKSILFSTFGIGVDTAAGKLYGVPGLMGADWPSAEDDLGFVLPYACSISLLTVRTVDGAPTATPVTTITVRKNGVDTAATLVMTQTVNTTTTDAVNSVDFAAGDRITISIETTGVGADSTRIGSITLVVTQK